MVWAMTRHGQALLIAVFLLALLLISIPVMVFINQAGSRHGILSHKKVKGSAIAEEGLDFACQLLLSSWPYSRGGSLPPDQTLTSAQGGSFSIHFTASPSPGLRTYQVGVLVTPFDEKGKPIPGGTLYAVVSQRTLGA